MDRQIIYWYKRGVASYLIAKKFGVSNSYVRKLLIRSGIKLRGHNVTNKMSADRRTPEENRAITAKATESNRGSVHTATHRAKLALSREINPTVDETYERPLLNYYKKKNVKAIPQKAFYKYNVDLYVPSQNVVIEIFGGGFHNKEEAKELFRNKMDYLSKKKIPVVIVWSSKENYSVENIFKIANGATQPLTIINGDGTPTTRGLKDITGV